MKLRLILLLLVLPLVSACGIYSFTGTSIQPDVQTITINYFEYKALKVNPSLSNDLTEAVKDQFRKLTRLSQVDMDGDLEITGEITGYDVRATAVTANEVAAQNRLTVTIKISFENKKYPEVVDLQHISAVRELLDILVSSPECVFILSLLKEILRRGKRH